MSSSLVGLFSQLKARVSDYIETAYQSNDPQFNSARTDLVINSDQSPVFRPPLFEPLARYVEAKVSAEDVLNIAGLGTLGGQQTPQLAALLKAFPPIDNRTLYIHQLDAIKNGISGKAELRRYHWHWFREELLLSNPGCSEPVVGGARCRRSAGMEGSRAIQYRLVGSIAIGI